MKLKFIALLAGLTLFALGTKAQVHHHCGTVEMQEQALRQNPSLQANIDWLEQFTQDKAKAGTPTLDTGTFIIPVVVHIVHDFGPENIPDSYVLDAIRIVNEDFQRRSNSLNSVSAPFAPIIGNAKFEFRLAAKDPNGNCTNGITRTVSSLTNNAGNNVKDLISWPSNRYLNVWVAGTVVSGSGTVGGFAYRPGNAPSPAYDGVIVTYRQFGSMGQSNGLLSEKTLSHEIGHFFNLAHTWGNSNTPGLASNCNIDDGVADTPNTTGVDNQSCNLNFAPCGVLTNVENIMDYASCPRMFTQGQAVRVRTAALSPVGGRSNLWDTLNLEITGVKNIGPAYTNRICAPKILFKRVDYKSCAGGGLYLEASSYNTPDTSVKFYWTLPGATNLRDTGKGITVTYLQPGTYNFTVTAANFVGRDSITVNGNIEIYSSDTGNWGRPAIEGFESTTFPVNDAVNLKNNWYIVDATSNTFTRVTNAFTQGRASLRLNNRTLVADAINTLMSPAIDLTNFPSPCVLQFDMAFAPINASNTDRLRVGTTLNCGTATQWRRVLTLAGTPNLSTVTGNITGIFNPTASQWRTETVNLEVMRNRGVFRLMFEVKAGGGNAFLIDNIRIGSITGISLSKSLSPLEVFPNPSKAEDLQFRIPEQVLGQNATLEWIDAVGRIKTASFQPSQDLVRLSDLGVSSLASGIYVVQLKTTKGIWASKVVIE